MHDRHTVLHRRVVEEVARGEVICAVDHDVVAVDDPIDIRGRQALLVADDLYVGIERFESALRGRDLRLADAVGGMKDLPLQIGEVDDVGVDDAERAHTRGREVVRGRRTQSARADEQDLAVQELLLTHLADLRDQQVPRVALRLGRREARGRRPRLAGILPAVEPACHGDHVAVPKFLESVRGHGRTDAAGAIQDCCFVFFGETILGPLLEIALRNVDRAGNVASVPLVLFANVAELDVARANQVLNLLGCRLADALLDVGEEIAIRRHSSSLVLNPKPTRPLGNSRYAAIFPWKRCLLTCSSSCTTWRLRSLSVVRSCSARRSRLLFSRRPAHARTQEACSVACSPASTGSRSSRWSCCRSRACSRPSVSGFSAYWHLRQTMPAVPTTSAGTYTSGKDAPPPHFVTLVASLARHFGSSSDSLFK